MAKQTTRDAALSRLFGNVAGEGAQKPQREAATAKEPKRTKRTKPKGYSKEAQAEKVTVDSVTEQGGGEAGAASVSQGAEQSPSAYLGLGRYTRSDGIVERITPYVRPDQAEALRLAVARKNDPRGTDVSQIIQTLLDEAGYRS